ncbi:MAG: hypothetical protein U0Q16_13400 [Bryobacteraceae bacterium]
MEGDTLALLEEKILKTVQAVTHLRKEKETALATASELQSLKSKLADVSSELESVRAERDALKADRDTVRRRIEKLLEQIETLNAG